MHPPAACFVSGMCFKILFRLISTASATTSRANKVKPGTKTYVLIGFECIVAWHVDATHPTRALGTCPDVVFL